MSEIVQNVLNLSKYAKVPLALFALQKIKIQGTYTIRVRLFIEFPPQGYNSSFIFIKKMNNEANFGTYIF